MREITIAVLIIGLAGGVWCAIYSSMDFKDVVFNFVQGFIIGVGVALSVVVLIAVSLLLLIGMTEILS